ncbi:N-acetylglucosamine-1-phosphotransferase subunits alpha/beta-like isoform X3 [Dinothrombium tinctorium]|uniref:N-acetylglucosamine-1-phosphotransferase subunits alpha/beta-like isoform X3 n=1 Tax=Dinothrombium tinctorium TaxID=1965070 RepID=A0A3S3PLA7_9ACAR|nr:N-acetylglucosamine-1-phosphotransferase subunits alpha/beta-like isoform X3 [Dinothrombium tinctorium]
MKNNTDGNLFYFTDIKEAAFCSISHGVSAVQNLYSFISARRVAKRKSFIYNQRKYEIFPTFIKLSCNTLRPVVDTERIYRTVTSTAFILLAGANWRKRQISRFLSKSERKLVLDVYASDIHNISLITLTSAAENVRDAIAHRLKNVRTNRGEWLRIVSGYSKDEISVIVGNDYNFDKVKYPLLEAVSPKRFTDNEELRFSLRSLQKYAPWIRNVFIVTNGQIPHWLNLANPRVKIITHEEIFADKKHLPTFNSAAIEINLHRIPGLSQKFLYLNDDIFLAKPIFPDDFYTHSEGYKVYLSWPVPNCEPNCPSNWIKDGFCDVACNTSSCSWDGGDCLVNDSSITNSRYSGEAVGYSSNSHRVNNCNSNCPDSWLADKFCDNVCNNEECAFDLGDCGVEDYHKLNGTTYDHNESSFHFPLSKSIFLNLTSAATREAHFELESAAYEKNEAIRAMAINLRDNVFTILLYNATKTNISVVFTYKLDYNNQTVEKYLQLIIDGKRRDENEAIGGASERSGVASLTLINNEISSTRMPIKFQTYSSLSQVAKKPKILSDYKMLSNQSFAGIELDNNHTKFDRYNSDNEIMKQKMEAIAERRKNGYLTAKGYAYELYKTHLLYERSNNKSHLFPWENTPLFEQIGRLIAVHDRYALDERPQHAASRHLKDIFADSLRHVNELYNNVFGVQIRKVPSHSAHLLDVSIIERWQSNFREEMAKTSSHRVRSADDMQYAFSYFYYLMSETRKVNVSEVINQFDTDSSNSLSNNELKTLRLHLEDASLSETLFHRYINECFEIDAEKVISESIAIKDLLSCEKLTEHISKHYAPIKMNAYQVVSDDEVAFKMVRSNASLFERELNELRKKPKKFICFNDDIDYSEHASNESQLVRSLLVEFYQSIVPERSQFELPAGETNPYLYVSEYRRYQQKHQYANHL